MNKSLTVDQVKSLLKNAYGFIDTNSVLMYCHESLIGEFTFFFNDNDGDDVECRLDGASLDGAELSVIRSDGNMEQFTVLIPLSLAKDVESFLID